MQSVEEAQAVALGVNHIGITPSNLGLPGEVDFATARAIVGGVGKRPGELCMKYLPLCYNSLWVKSFGYKILQLGLTVCEYISSRKMGRLLPSL